MEPTFSSCALATFCLQFGGFLLAYALQTETFFDVLGGVNFVGLGLWTYFSSNAVDPLRSWATGLFVLSRGWLVVFLAWRAHERGGDGRFDGVKDRAGLFLVYWMVQAFWVYLVSLPTMYVNLYHDAVAAPPPYGYDDHFEPIVLVLFAVGIATAIVADVQKAWWAKQTQRAGGFCRVGLWRYSRHPNYFGEILQWWCSFLLVVPMLLRQPEISWGWGCVCSPLFTCWILLFATGTGLTDAEGKGLKRYYENKTGDTATRYSAYRESTSILVPMVGYSHLPMWFKRTFLFEWKRYEYKPKQQ